MVITLNTTGVAMIEVITPDIAFLYQDKLDEMFKLRHRVFKECLDWDVNSRNGRERDVYDLLRPVYLLATDENGKVGGSWRLLPTTGPYMLRDVFPDLLEGAQAPSNPQVWEISRFAVDRAGDGTQRRNSVNRFTSELFAGMVEWALLYGIREIVAVYDVRVGRLLNKIDFTPHWVSQPRRIGSTVAMAGRFEVSDPRLAAIRAAGGIHESVLVHRDLQEVQHAA